MSQYNAGASKGYTTTSALADGILVKLSAGNVVPATAGTDLTIGVSLGASAANTVASIRLRTAEGTCKVLAGGTIAVGDAVTATAAGKALTTVTVGNQIFGYALEAGVIGDFIEVLPSMAKY